MIRSFTHEDKDYIINSHYELYNKEYNYDLSFRDFIEEKVEDIIKKSYDNENTWILEIERAKRGLNCKVKCITFLSNPVGIRFF